MLVVTALKDILFDIIKSNNNLLKWLIVKDSSLLVGVFAKAWGIDGWFGSIIVSK